MQKWSTYFQNPAFMQSSRMTIMNRDVAEDVVGYLGLREGMRVLDVGCGIGALVFYLGKHVNGVSFTGVDLDETFIKTAQEQALQMPGCNSYTFCHGDAVHLQFSEGSYDMIVSQTLLTSLPEYRDAIKEMSRVCINNGMIASITPISIWNPVFSAGHYPESHTYYSRLCELREKVHVMMEATFPMKQFVQGIDPTEVPRIFHEMGLGDVSVYPLGKFFSLSNAATDREDKTRYVMLSHQADVDKFGSFWQLDKAKHYLTEMEAAEYLALLKEKRDSLLRDMGENAIWEWQGGTNLLVTGVVNKTETADVARARSAQTELMAPYNQMDILFLSIDRNLKTQQVGGLGLLCLTAYLKQFAYVPKTYIGKAHNCKPFLIDLLEQKRTGIVGLYITAENLPIVRNIHRFIKNYGVTTILGGPETVALGECEIREIGCDFVIDGEGELPLKALMDFLLRGEGALGTIEGLRYIDQDGRYVAELPPGKVIQDLDTIGFIEMDDVLNPEYRFMIERNILTGRGCPFHCAFCYEGSQRGKVRNRSIENVFAEIDHFLDVNPNIMFFMISDDTFTLDPERVRAICDGFAQRKISFSCEAHVQMLDKYPDMLQYMVSKGLKIIQIGLESGSQKVLNAYGKNTSPEMIRRVVENAKKSGLISMEGNIIIGGAFEDRQTLQESRWLASELLRIGRGMFVCNSVLYSPFPKTQITTCPDRFGMKIDADQVKFTLQSMNNCVVSTEALTRDEIAQARVSFEDLMEKTFREEVTLLTRKELQDYYFGEKDYIRYNQTWHTLITNTPHLMKFLRMGFLHTNMFDLDAVILRTFPGLIYDSDGALTCGLHRIYGKERHFLELSTGAYTLHQLSDLLGLENGEVYTIYQKLYDLCLVYRSPF